MNPRTIKLIIALAIIVILIIADILVISYLNKKAHDIYVLSDISQIRSGLELHLQQNVYYPKTAKQVSLNDVYSGTEKLCTDGFKKSADPCPRLILNPIPNFFLAQGNNYLYQSLDEGADYNLEFNLKTNFLKYGLKKGKNCASSQGIVSQPCFSYE